MTKFKAGTLPLNMRTDCSTAGRIADLVPTEDKERENAVLPEVSEDGHVS